MDHSIKVGFSFGMVSGIITTLGLIVGLYAGTNSKIAVLGGIIVIAVSDAFSDALGIHISEESENHHTPKEIWVSTISTFIAKFLFSSIFIFPVLLLDLNAAVIASVLMGLFFLVLISWILADRQKISPWKVISEHLIVACLVVILTHVIGNWVSSHLH